VNVVQVTFDTGDPIDDVIKVLEAVYGVQIRVQSPSRKTRHD
jgi:hypothetical protein